MNTTTHAWAAGFGATLLLLLAGSHESSAQGTPKPTTKDLTNPSPVRASVDPSTQIGTVRLPTPLERSTRTMDKLGLKPTQLQSGHAVNYSVKNVEDRDGRLYASCIGISKRNGYWIFYSLGRRECPSIFALWFRTERGKQYLVDFAFDPSRPTGQFYAYDPSHRNPAPLPVTVVDGHVAQVVTGSGGELAVQLESMDTTGFVLFHVKVTPLS